MKNKRRLPAFNAGAMADIAFLLLIFFLVATEINQDKAVSVILPPYSEQTAGKKIPKKNLLKIHINGSNDILINSEEVRLDDVKNIVSNFVANPHKETNKTTTPSDAVISLMNDFNTDYKSYILLYAQIKAAYSALRNDYSMETFGVSFDALDKEKKKGVADVYKIKISEAEFKPSKSQ